MELKVFTDGSECCEAPSECHREAARQLLNEYLGQATAVSRFRLLDGVRPKECEAGRKIVESPRELQVAIVVEAASQLARYGEPDSSGLAPIRCLLSTLLRRKLRFDRSAIESLVTTLRIGRRWWDMPVAGILRALETYIEQHGMTETVREGLESLRGEYNADSDSAEERKIGKRIEAILAGGNTEFTQFDLNTGEPWADALMVEMGRLDTATRANWQALLAHCATAKSSKPSRKWLKTAGDRMAPIGAGAFVDVLIHCLDAIGRPGASRQVLHGGWTHFTDPTQVHDTHADLLRGLVWTTGLVPDEKLIGAVGDAAEICFQKIPNIGPRSPKIGNACLQALVEMNHLAAVAQISRLKTRAKHASIRKQLGKALERAAERVGMTEADLEEIAVPTFGMTEVGRYEEQVGDVTATLALTPNAKPRLLWAKPDGKTQKSVPAAIKETHVEQIKALKRKVKELEKLLPAQRNRIEQLFLRKRRWSLGDFRERLLDHPLVGVVARRLIWRFQDDDRTADGVWHEGKLVDSQGRELTFGDDQTSVTIWHPLLGETDEVLRWREWLERLEVRQPFKQAHREIYILTDAERETGRYSDRFAAHILRQHQFAALCQQRGWRYSLEGAWDSANTPYLELPEWGFRVEYLVAAREDRETSPMGIYLYMSTDQVRFVGLPSSQPVDLADVPVLVFSEVMRDLDLFVSVASIGNDPEWSDGRYLEYRQDYAFGDCSPWAQTRRDVLQRLVPQLGIADRCSFEETFLVVRGDLHTFKIHFGSGQVLMSPENVPLCIVPRHGAGTKRTDNLFLPFDGDDMLAVILSKAFLLAEDAKIKDDSILAQIRRCGDPPERQEG